MTVVAIEKYMGQRNTGQGGLGCGQRMFGEDGEVRLTHVLSIHSTPNAVGCVQPTWVSLSAKDPGLSEQAVLEDLRGLLKQVVSGLFMEAEDTLRQLTGRQWWTDRCALHRGHGARGKYLADCFSWDVSTAEAGQS